MKLGNTYEAYKRYQNKYLPQCKTIEGYELPDFEPEENNYIIDKLQIWLTQSNKYTHHLVQAANLRQQHFNEFIKNKLEEEINHKKFRKNLNKLGEDGEQKLQYWQSIHDKLFDRAVKTFEKAQIKTRPRKRANVDLDVINIDFEPTIKSNKVVRKPKMSDKEKKKRKKERKKRKVKREKEEELAIKNAQTERIESLKLNKNYCNEAAQIDGDVILAKIKEVLNKECEIPEINEHCSNSQIYFIPDFVGKRVTFEEIGSIYAKVYYFMKPRCSEIRLDEIGVLRYNHSFCHGFLSSFLISIWKLCPKIKTDDNLSDFAISITVEDLESASNLIISQLNYNCIDECREYAIEKLSGEIEDDELFQEFVNFTDVLNMWKPEADLFRKVITLKMLLDLRRTNLEYANFIYNNYKINEPEVFSFKINHKDNDGFMNFADREGLSYEEHKTLFRRVKKLFESK